MFNEDFIDLAKWGSKYF